MSGQDPEELKRRIGERLASARKEQGMTQEGFAALVGTSIQWVSRVERGEENLTILTLVKLSDALGMRVAELLEDQS